MELKYLLFSFHVQIDVINGLHLLSAKPVTYLVNLSERDYVRKKNKWLPKIKAWIDQNNPGDPLIPFSVALEERLAQMSDEEKEEETKKIGAGSALGKITQAGYASLDVSPLSGDYVSEIMLKGFRSLSGISLVGPTKSVLGLSVVGQKRLKPPVSSSESSLPPCHHLLFAGILMHVYVAARTSRTSSCVVRS